MVYGIETLPEAILDQLRQGQKRGWDYCGLYAPTFGHLLTTTSSYGLDLDRSRRSSRPINLNFRAIAALIFGSLP
jgi:hypothetical protein